MSRKRKFVPRYLMSDSEEWLIRLLADSRFSYKGIARYVYGSGRVSYEPSSAEIGRVGRVLQNYGIKVRDMRNGLTLESRRVMRDIDKASSKIQSSSKTFKIHRRVRQSA